jgi:hypothetical protein
MKNFFKQYAMPLILVLVGFYSIYLGQHQKIFKTSGDVILFITFLAVIWYSDETRKMKNQMIQQNTYEHSPYLFAELKSGDSRIYVKNFGPGLATNVSVSIKDVALDPSGWQLKMQESYKDFIKPDDTIGFIYTREKIEINSVAHQLGLTNHRDMEITLMYSDKLGSFQYRSSIEYKNKKIQLKKWEVI